jgi:hypothetical protein
MNPTLLARTARRLETTSSSHLTHLIRSYSVKSGSIPPRNAAQGVSGPTPQTPTSDDAHAPTPPPVSTQNTPVVTTDVSGLDIPTISTQTLPSLDFAPPEPGVERERTGAKSSKDSLSSIERRRRQMGRVSFGLFALGLLGGCVYLGREWTEEELVSRRSVRAFLHGFFFVDHLTNIRSERGSRARFAVGSYDQPVLVDVRRMAFMMTRYS